MKLARLTEAELELARWDAIAILLNHHLRENGPVGMDELAEDMNRLYGSMSRETYHRLFDSRPSKKNPRPPYGVVRPEEVRSRIIGEDGLDGLVSLISIDPRNTGRPRVIAALNPVREQEARDRLIEGLERRPMDQRAPMDGIFWAKHYINVGHRPYVP